MKPTKAQKKFWDNVASIGCIACRFDGVYNPMVSIHHLDGREKPNSHWLVIGLCGEHHQGVNGFELCVHSNKARFERQYGKQIDLLKQTLTILNDLGYDYRNVEKIANTWRTL